MRPAHRDYEQHEAHPEQWLLIEWPQGEAEPTKYWLSNLPPETKLKELVALAKHRWIIERDYQELKQELGLNQYEGRGWRGLHHHGTLCIAAYGFLVGERSRFPPLRASRPDTNIPAREVCAIPPARGARYGPSGIIRNRSPRCDTRSPTTCCTSSTPAIFAAPHFYNTVVLAARGRSVFGRKWGTATDFRSPNWFIFNAIGVRKSAGCPLFSRPRTSTTKPLGHCI